MPSHQETSGNKSITRWIRYLEAGDDDAARLLWNEYFTKLVDVARRQLGNAPNRVADEEDVALSVFRCLCDGARRSQLCDVGNRHELWRLLVVITNHKVVDQRRRERAPKRGGGRVRGDSVFAELASCDRGGFDQFVGEAPTPEFLLIMSEQHQRLMGLLPDETLRKVALRKLEGGSNEEIAKELGLARRSIQRKLSRIREAWLSEVEI